MKNYLLYFLILFGLLMSCKKDNGSSTKIFNIKGYIQKGPFVKGTTITISELKDDLSQTGRNFNTTIVDDKGSFEISNIGLSSNFIYLSASGYFYNEIIGALSNSMISLNAIVNLQNNQNINVNIITTIESERVEYLVQKGSDFETAKTQARNEIFNIFGFSYSNSGNPETFDITQSGINNSILLAISAIILGTHTEAELTELISGISSDLKTDGKLDNTIQQSDLINEAKLLDINSVKINLEKRYSDLGTNIVINDFDKYVDTFINKTNYVFTKKIEYPGSVNSLLNVLSDTLNSITGGLEYSIAANLPKGTSIKVIFKPTNGYSFSGIGIAGQNNGWTINSSMADSTNLTAIGSGQNISIGFMTGPPTSVDFYIYENNSKIPTKIKVLKNY